MPYVTVSKLTTVLACDICGEEIPDTTYRGGSDHRGTLLREYDKYGPRSSGSVLFGWIAYGVSSLTRHAHLKWPPPSWARTKDWDERPPERTYDFHGECIVALVEKAVADRTSPDSSTGSDQ